MMVPAALKNTRRAPSNTRSVSFWLRTARKNVCFGQSIVLRTSTLHTGIQALMCRRACTDMIHLQKAGRLDGDRIKVTGRGLSQRGTSKTSCEAANNIKVAQKKVALLGVFHCEPLTGPHAAGTCARYFFCGFNNR